MTEADVPYAMAIGIFACTNGAIRGFRFASSGNKKTTKTPASIDSTGEELSCTRGEFKDYRDTVDGEFSEINHSIRRLNKAYAALLNNFVTDAEKLCPDNKDALKIATNDRDLVTLGSDNTTQADNAANEPVRKTA